MSDWNNSPSASERTRILNDRLFEAAQRVPWAAKYRHKKGGIYEISGYSINTDTGNVDVRYKRIGGPDFDAALEQGIFFSRPIEEFTEDRFVRI